MSRIGNRILSVPNGVEIAVDANNVVTVKGPKGTLVKSMPSKIKIIVDNQTVRTERPDEIKSTKQLHGTTNSLINGMLVGVSEGFKKELQILGVGYKAALQTDKIILNLGFSHPVEYKIPATIKVEVPKPTQVIVSGIDKQLVGEVAANLRNYKKPEPYKGKGIRYVDEYVIRKVGKAAGK